MISYNDFNIVWSDAPNNKSIDHCFDHCFVRLYDHHGNMIPDSEITLYDYTLKNRHPKDTDVAFEVYAYYDQKIHKFSHQFSDNLTLEGVKHECESYLLYIFNTHLKSVKEELKRLEPICQWLNEYLINNHYEEHDL